MDLAELRRLSLFDGLDDGQLGDLLAASTEQVTRRGELLFTEGRPADSWWVLLDGTVALIRQVGTEESVLGYMTEPGQWAGGFAAWDEFGVYFATGRAENPGRVLRLAAPELRRLSEQWFPFGLHFIDGLVNTVRRIESTARQREALVALGTLSAGLAHELNNPASAATRAVDALQGTSELVLSSLAQLARQGHHRRAVHRARRAAAAGQRPRAGAGRARPGRPRGRAVRLARPTTTSTATG